jgi:hypothetical protein
MYVPHYEFINASDGSYHWFAIGRVCFLLTDTRWRKTPRKDSGISAGDGARGKTEGLVEEPAIAAYGNTKRERAAKVAALCALLLNSRVLEVILQTELKVAGADLRAGDLAEAGRAEARVRISEDGSVGRILRFEAQLNALAFHRRNALQ